MSAARPAVRVELRGGLGNQMFQYAAGRSLALRLGAELVLETSWFTAQGEGATRRFELDAFPIRASIDAQPRSRVARRVYDRLPPAAARWLGPTGAVPTVREPHFAYWEGLGRVRAPVRLSGYWQSPRYFASEAAVIREELAFPPLPAGRAAEWARRIGAADCPVSVHVRGGDYRLTGRAAAVHGDVCPPDYYRRALERLAPAGGVLDVFVFSDEPDWARSRLDPGRHRVDFVELPESHESAVHEMHLMSLPSRHVIANSTFSWWAAWLDPSPERQVIAPARWFGGPLAAESAADLVPADWPRL